VVSFLRFPTKHGMHCSSAVHVTFHTLLVLLDFITRVRFGNFIVLFILSFIFSDRKQKGKKILDRMAYFTEKLNSNGEKLWQH
jgi:hypothetical protein